MAAIITEPAELLLQLIMDTDALTDEQKNLYISELLEGRIHPELAQSLDALIEQTIQSTTRDAGSVQAEIAAIDSLLAEATQEEERGNAATLAEYTAELDTIIVDQDRKSVV